MSEPSYSKKLLLINGRWSFYVLLWAVGATIPPLLTIPETLPGKILVNKARRIRESNIPGFENVQAPMETSDRTLTSIFKVTLLRPWRLLFDPIAFCYATYSALVYMLLYMLFAIYPIVFREKRGWNAGISELPLLGTGIGACLGGVFNFYFVVQDGKKRLAGETQRPGDRLAVAKFGGLLLPVAMFWFAWTANYNSIHWIVPTLVGVFLSMAIFPIFVGYLNYLVNVYTSYAASVLAATTVLRACCGAAAPLFTPYMFKSLGVA